jgi:hypothetical protein
MWGGEQKGSSIRACADDNESKAVLDAFFLGKAFAEAFMERVESVVGEVFSVVRQWQAEQQKQVQESQVLRHSVLALDEHSQYFVFHVNSPMSSLVIDDGSDDVVSSVFNLHVF